MIKDKNPAVVAAWISGGLGCVAAITVAIISLVAVIIQINKSNDPPSVVPTGPPLTVEIGTTLPETTLEVINNTSEDICYLYIVPNGSETLGQGRLDVGETIAPNKGLRYSMETGMYDLRAENCASSLSERISGRLRI